VTERVPPPLSALAQADDEVLARLAAQRTDAFTELYRRHAQRVYRYLLSRVGDIDVAQELTAETFMAVLQSIAHFRAQSSFVTWLLGIAHHKAADHFRRRRETISLELLGEMPQPDSSPDEALTSKLQLELVRRALAALSPERAEAIRLHVFAGLGMAEVAHVMHKNEAAVRMLIYRALRDLRARLAPAPEVEHESK
jgi:RNA polymerase sigma-70 factor, ECF subfamily